MSIIKLSVLLVITGMLMGCNGNQTKNTSVVTAGEDTVSTIVTSLPDSVVGIGAKMGGHFDKANNYWLTEDIGYETSSISETSPYTKLERVDKKGNYLGKGLINNKGEVVVAPKYASLNLGFNKHGICVVGDDNDKWGLVTNKGQEVKPEYSSIWDDVCEGDWVKVQNNDLQGYINLKGEIVIPLEYLSLGEPSEGLIEFCKEPQRWGYINTKNEVVIEPLFTNARPFENGKVVLQKPGGIEYIVYKDGRIEKK